MYIYTHTYIYIYIHTYTNIYMAGCLELLSGGLLAQAGAQGIRRGLRRVYMYIYIYIYICVCVCKLTAGYLLRPT